MDFHEKLAMELDRRLLERVKIPRGERSPSSLYHWLGLRRIGYLRRETDHAYRQAVEALRSRRGHLTTTTLIAGDALGENVKKTALAGLDLAAQAEEAVAGLSAALQTVADENGFGADWVARGVEEVRQAVRGLVAGQFSERQKYAEQNIARREAAREEKLWDTSLSDAETDRHLRILRMEMQNADPDHLLSLFEREARAGQKAAVDLLMAQIEAEGRTNDPQRMGAVPRARAILKAVQDERAGSAADFEAERQALKAIDAVRAHVERRIGGGTQAA